VSPVPWHTAPLGSWSPGWPASGSVTRAQHTASVTHETLPGTDLLGALRGTPALRPSVDRGLAGGLRAWLEDGLFERRGPVGSAVVRVTPSLLRAAPATAALTARLRGVLLVQLLRLLVAGYRSEAPFEDASVALGASGRDDELVTVLYELDADERSRLVAEVGAHYAVLVATLPSLPARWSPRCGVRSAISLAGGTVVLSGEVDLALGAAGGSRACVCLVDLTTSALGSSTETTLAYLALLETLRTGEQPFRVAAMSTADATTLVRDVTPELLSDAVNLVLDAIPRSAAA